MNTGQQFKHSVWIVNVLRKYGRLTLSEMSELWVAEEVAGGNPLPRSSFNKYRDDILDMFGLIIECDKSYHYYISNPSEIESDQTKQWQLSTLTTGLTLRESSTIKVCSQPKSLIRVSIAQSTFRLLNTLLNTSAQ